MDEWYGTLPERTFYEYLDQVDKALIEADNRNSLPEFDAKEGVAVLIDQLREVVALMRMIEVTE